MSIPQAICPDCSAKLSSKVGFTAGQKIKCPKCDTVFAVLAPKKKPVVLEDDEERPPPKKKKPVLLEEDEEPRPVKKKKKPVIVEDDEEEDERPRRKKKGKDKSESEGSFANSPLRFVILGVLVVVMLVMGYFLYKKLTAPPLPDIIVPAKPVPGED
jgi:phage FluMu protein Com